jgi:C4-dicarboxylate-specific signal transduction histidine kinase
VGEYRVGAQQSLEQAEQISWLAGGIRGLVEADDPGDNCQVLPLDVYITEVLGDLLPLAESAQVELSPLCGSAGHVLFESQRLRQALFCLLEFALVSAHLGATLKVEVQEEGTEAVLVLTTRTRDESLPRNTSHPKLSPGAGNHELQRRLSLAIARRTFEAAGGSVQATESEEGPWIQVRLPLTGGSQSAPR